MKGNDLGNYVMPRDVLVWENLLGLLPDPKTAATEERFRNKKRWRDAVDLYVVNELLARKVVELAWRHGLRVDLLTYHGKEFATALRERMDEESMPFSKVWSEKPNVLARSLALQPDIRTIYDPHPEHQFLYGGKGRVLEPATAHYYFGVL